MKGFMFIYDGKAKGLRHVNGAFHLQAEKAYAALRKGVSYLAKLDIKADKVKIQEWPRY